MLWEASVNGLVTPIVSPMLISFSNTQKKKIQVQTSCLRLVRWMLKPRQFVLGESWALGGWCVFIVFGGLFGITEGI